MAADRLKAGMWVAAALRLGDGEGRPGAVLRRGDADGGGVVLHCRDTDTGRTLRHRTGVVVAATGYRTELPPCLGGLGVERDPETGGPRLGRRYAAAWDGPRENRVYVQNAGRLSHGIADPQLALLAWRSAAILNGALGRRAFALDDDGALIEWSRNGDAA